MSYTNELPMPVSSQEGQLDSTNALIFPDNFEQTITYNGDGTVNTISFTNGTNTWTQTMSYTTSRLTGISKWVRS